MNAPRCALYADLWREISLWLPEPRLQRVEDRVHLVSHGRIVAIAPVAGDGLTALQNLFADLLDRLEIGL